LICTCPEDFSRGGGAGPDDGLEILGAALFGPEELFACVEFVRRGNREEGWGAYLRELGAFERWSGWREGRKNKPLYESIRANYEAEMFICILFAMS